MDVYIVCAHENTKWCINVYKIVTWIAAINSFIHSATIFWTSSKVLSLYSGMSFVQELAMCSVWLIAGTLFYDVGNNSTAIDFGETISLLFFNNIMVTDSIVSSYW